MDRALTVMSFLLQHSVAAGSIPLYFPKSHSVHIVKLGASQTLYIQRGNRIIGALVN